MIVSIIPRFSGLFFVPVIFLEQADRLPLVRADDNLPLFSLLRMSSIGSDKVDFILRVGHSHASGLRLHPREGPQGQGRFGLPESFHQPYARDFQESLIYGIVQRLSGRSTVFQRGQVIFAEVFPYEEPVDGRRGAKGCDMVVMYLLQDVGRSELLVIVDEDVCPGYHLPVDLAPRRLGPSCVGYGEMQAVPVQVVPVFCRHDMSQRIGEVMGHHFRLPGSAGGEIHQHDVIVGVHFRRTGERCGILYPLVEIEEAIRTFGPYADKCLEARAFRCGIQYVFQYHIFPRSHYHLDGCGPASVDYVLFRQEMCRGDGHGPYLVQGNDRKPEFIAALEHEHYHVSLAYSQALEPGCRHVSVSFQVAERELDAFALVICPQQGFLVGFFLRPCIHDVVSEIEIVRYIYPEIPYEVLLRGKSGLA